MGYALLDKHLTCINIFNLHNNAMKYTCLFHFTDEETESEENDLEDLDRVSLKVKVITTKYCDLKVSKSFKKEMMSSAESKRELLW